MPTKRPGAFRPLASAVTEIDEVLEARTQRSSTLASSSRNRARLASAFSMIASTTRPAPAASSSRSTARMRATVGLRLLGVELALGDQAVERLLELGAGRGGGAFARVEQPHRVPGLRRDLGDARAHDAGADDQHRRARSEIDVHPSSLGRAASASLQAGRGCHYIAGQRNLGSNRHALSGRGSGRPRRLFRRPAARGRPRRHLPAAPGAGRRRWRAPAW